MERGLLFLEGREREGRREAREREGCREAREREGCREELLLEGAGGGLGRGNYGYYDFFLLPKNDINIVRTRADTIQNMAMSDI